MLVLATGADVRTKYRFEGGDLLFFVLQLLLLFAGTLRFGDALKFLDAAL